MLNMCSPQKNANQNDIGILSQSCRNGYHQENKKSNNPGEGVGKIGYFYAHLAGK